MRPSPIEVLHIFEAGKRRAEVQQVNEKYRPFRVVYMTKKSGEIMRDEENPYWVHIPTYHNTEDEAKQKARRWAFRN